MMRLRSPALRALHRQQIGLLRRWREPKASGEDAADLLLSDILLTINAIPSGIGSTG
jgi:phosphoenolpyruvate carboxylase